MQPPIEKLERLAAAGIGLVPAPGITTHFIFHRERFAALVERRGDDFGQIGSSGLLTESGLAVLVWREGRGDFVARGFTEPASEDQVAALRAFARDLEIALSG